MMTMSRAISAGQALDYYQQEFTNSKDNYYSEAGEVIGRWSGRLADEWELRGEVTSEQYERLVAGQDPRTGEQLVQAVTARDTVNAYGEQVTTAEHRAGWDATISAPKSVSLAALVGDDERVKVAHRESVNEALKGFEEYLQARGGGDKPSITTGKMVAAQFEHTSSRPDRTNGYAAPQLHTHVVVFNMTQTEDAGKVRSVQPLELFRSQKYATAIYRAHLAEKLQGLGYEIEVDPRTGAPEIKGFSEAYLQESSPRREEVLKEAEQIKERLEREGITVVDNAGLKHAAAHNDRASKQFDRTEMRERALAMDTKHSNQARLLVGQAQERGPFRLAQDQITTRAQEAVTFARDNAVEREAVADMRQVMSDALRRNLGRTTYEAVSTELRRRQELGEFIDIRRDPRSPETTTRRMLQMEQDNIQTVMHGKGSSPAVVRAARVEDVVANSAQNHQLKLNANQQSALETILSSEDQIVGLQGGAGTGKTTVLSVLREAAEKEGYQVRGFAPTTRAAKQLAESGINTETLQKFLRRRQEPTTSKQLFVLDESSLASTKQLHKFFGRLEAEDKVLLVGDVRQHQAVEAGSPFEQLQKHGMTTAQLNEIVRQRDPELKQTVAKLSVRNIREAVAELESRGKVIEIQSERERFERMAQDYCKQPTNTLVISPANRERTQLNSLIHRQLQREGKVSRDDHQMNVYVNRQDMTGAGRTFANSYRPGEDTIRYNRASKVYNVQVGDYASVTATNHERNELTVRFANGRTLTYDPTRLSGVSVYNEAERSFAESDRIQFRAPFAEKRIVNGELGSITKIEPDHLRVALDSGREVSFDPQQFRHLDHGYAVTSHSSQGLTVDRVLINADTQESLRLLNDRMAYVAVSRAREEALIYTDSTQNLRASLNRATNKEMALEATNHKSREIQQDRDGLTNDHLTAHEQTHNNHGIDQNSAQIDPTQEKAAEFAVESEGEELAFLI